MKDCTGSLFQDEVVLDHKTEGIKYAGSKLKLIPHILRLASQTGATSVFDAFAGTTRVSQAFANSGYRVVCNDTSVWTEIFANCYLLSRKNRSEYEELISHLNNVPAIEGWFTEHYGGEPISPSGQTTKKPWQRHNTRRLDGIREEIDRLNLDNDSKCVALTSLILALDEVDSTMGHFASYLRDWSPRSFKALEMRVPKIAMSREPHSIHRRDALDLAPQIDTDLAYYDPPYGSNNEKMPPSRVRYAAYYHVWTTICLNDRPPTFGKVGRRDDSSDKVSSSVFEEFRRDESGRFVAVEAIERLLKSTKSRWTILSYSSGGRATADELHRVITQYGRLVGRIELDYKKNVMSGMQSTGEWLRDAEQPHREFLFLLERNG